jgi:hypothetical protein
MKIPEYKRTEFFGKMATILNDHPHSGEVALCLGAEKTLQGWGMKFQNTETKIEFFVWNGADVYWENKH